MGSTRRTVVGSLGLLATGTVPVLAACGGAGAGTGGADARPAKLTQPATLVFWTNLSGADGSRMKELAEQYARENPLVTVDQIQGITPYFDKVYASVAAGSPPDVLGCRMPYVPTLANQGALADLSPREIQQLGLRAEDFEPNVWKSGEFNGKRYSIPIDLNGHMLLYNETAVRDLGADPNKMPDTWTGWLDLTTRLTKDGTHGTAFDHGGEAAVVMFMHHLHQQGGRLFSADGKKAAFNTPQGVAALAMMADVYQRARLPVQAPQGQGLIDLFEQRKLPTWLNGPWNLNRLAKPESPAFNDLRVSLAPQYDPKKPVWMAQGFQLTLPKQPKQDEARRAAAFGLINFVFGRGYEWSQAGKIPANKKVLASEQFQKSTDPVIKHLRLWEKYLPNATLIELNPKFVQAVDAVHPMLTPGIRKEQSPQSALGEAERALNAVLAG